MTSPAAERTTIVVADDDPTLLKTILYILRDRGHHVVPVEGGEGLIDVLRAEQPDLLLLDIMMPKVDGLQLLETIRSDPAWESLPVLMISSMPPEEATAQALGLGADDFIAKPFRVRELVARVDARLRQSRTLRDARADARRLAEEARASTAEARVRAEMLDILHEITDTLKPDDIYHVLARRVARVLGLARCSMVLAHAGDRFGLVVAAFENPHLRNLQIELRKYPEIRRALDRGQAVLVQDVTTDPLYDQVRKEWVAEGIQVVTRSAIALPFSLRKEQRGVFFLRATQEDKPLSPEDVEFASTVIGAAVTAIDRAYDLESAITDRERYLELAQTDALTGCANRRGLFERMESELERVKRYGQTLAVLLVDLDNFKDVNDGRGHAAGDTVLRGVGELLRKEARAVDIVGRYGGDEFVLGLPETTFDGAVVFAERLRVRLAEHDFAESGDPLYVTASIGVSAMPESGVDTVEGLIARADVAMYSAKNAGRNQVKT
ncbi:MAG: diguanylate cyclase [Gemmatimonadota bacterium]|nr:diguanylate cyclase [Gemmatimonadota bacterium]